MLEIQAIGHIGRDAETKDFNGRQYLSFSIADTVKYTAADGTRKETTTWVSCLKPVHNSDTPLAQFLRKGKQVFIRGPLSVKTYTAKDGSLQTSVECRVRDLQLLSSGQDAQPQPVQQQWPTAQPKTYPQQNIDEYGLPTF